MRTSSTQLPSYKELSDILDSEARRKIPKEKEGRHYSDFTTIINLLESFDLSTDFFIRRVQFEDYKDATLFEKVVIVYNDLVTNVLSAQNDTTSQKFFNDVYDYLAEEDKLQKADLIFVFGSKQIFRTEKAIKLYKQRYASKILISGKSPFYEREENVVSEAESLGEFAVKRGVPEDVLILEKEAISVPDNVKRSLNLLEKENIPHSSIILVNSTFSQRRGWVHFSKMSNEGTKLLRVNADKVTERFSREGWYRDEVGTRVIIKEFFGLWVSNMINTS